MSIQTGELKLYDVEDLAKLLDIQERTVRKLFKDGKLKGRKLARKWYITEEALRDYFSQAETDSHLNGHLMES
jgi:excisionase family DNA binding protein